MIKQNLFILIIFYFVFNPLYSQNSDTTKLSLLFVGDIMGHDGQISSAFDESLRQYDYHAVFRYVKPYLSEADFTIANLELTLAGPPYKGYPRFSSPDEIAVACKDAGIDVLMTANNHSCDNYATGINLTIEKLDSLKILHSGTFTDSLSRSKNNLLILEKNNIRAGLLNYTYGTNELKAPYPTLVNYLDTTIIFKDIEKAHTDSLDKLILFIHWGIQYELQPRKEQEALAKILFSKGVDMIIGSHPHVVQRMEWDKTTDRVLVYSLGNFVSNQRTAPRDGGLIFRVELEKSDNKTKVSKTDYLLTWVYKPFQDGKYHFYILPCIDFEKSPEYFGGDGSFKKMESFLNSTRPQLKKENININEYLGN